MPAPSDPTSAVFLSYASQDAEAAARICEALRAVGVGVWLDQSDLRGGDAWDTQIKKQIHECALFIPVISAHTNARNRGLLPPRMEPRRAATPGHGTGHRFPGAGCNRRDARSWMRASPRNSCARIGPDCPAARRRPRLLIGYANCWTRMSPPWAARTLSPGRAASRSRAACTTGSGNSRLHGSLQSRSRQSPQCSLFGWIVREWGVRDGTRRVGRSSARHDRIAVAQRRRARLRESRRFGRDPISSPREFRKRCCISSACCRG